MPKSTPDLFTNSANLSKTRHIYTVSEITQDIKIILENTFGEVWVEGEISGIRKIATGTVFFALKDNNSLLSCVMFFSHAAELKFEIKDGMQIICFGKVSVYEKDGKYQLYAEKIEPKGVGSLQLALEQLKQKLEKEGLFRQEHKRAMPYLPSRIGVVTSLQGAAIKDILKVLDRRFKDVNIVINSVRVQGEGAKEEIALAIADFNIFNEQLSKDERIEVLIVGRGGGSIEDLWAFNEEIVARAIYNSKIPVISAVGHERDVTVADLVADLRAATPSVAAELVIPKKEDLRERLEDLTFSLKRYFSDITISLQENIDDMAHRLSLSTEHILELNISEFKAAHKKLIILNPALLIQQYKAKAIDLSRQIYVRMVHCFRLKESRLLKSIEKLSSLSPLNILSRGYSITFKIPEGQIIKDINFIKVGDKLKTRLHKGEVYSSITEVIKHG